MRRRMDTTNADGLPLTATVAAAALAAWIFGGLTQDLVANDGTAGSIPAYTRSRSPTAPAG